MVVEEGGKVKVFVVNVTNKGGVGVVMKKLCKTLKEMGHYVVCSGNGEFPNCCDEQIEIKESSLEKFLGYLVRFLATHTKIRKVAKTVDIIFTHEPLVCKECGMIVYIDGRDWDRFYRNLNVFGKVINYLPLLYAKMAVRQSTILLLNSKSREFFVRNYAKKIIYTPNGIDFKPVKSHKKDYDFIFVGRFSPEKNPQLILDTFSNTKYKGVMIGSNTECTVGNIKVLKFMPRERVFDYISRSRIGIVPSKHETAPMVILEFLSHGLPTIVSDSIDTDTADYCIKFKCCDKKSLLETFEHVYENYSYYEKKYRKISRIVLKKYNWDTILVKSISEVVKNG